MKKNNSVTFILLLMIWLMPQDAIAAEYVGGDVNNDYYVNVADANAIIRMMLDRESSQSADVNGDGEVSIADVNAVIDMILHPDKNPYFVDLGLPSGTLWATRNVGANSPEEFGEYFAWGETETDEFYDWEHYKWGIYIFATRDVYLTKYNTNSNHGDVDSKMELECSDDAAYVNWCPWWRMPTADQIEELRIICTWEWTQYNGVNGQLVTGPNGRSIFLPAVGDIIGNKLWPRFVGSDGCYWSRSLSTSRDFPDCATRLCFGCVGASTYNYSRYAGCAVRPVRSSGN